MRLTPACLAFFLVTSSALAAEPGGRIKVLVLDVKSTDLTPGEVDTLTSLVTAHLARSPQLDVLSGADLKRLVDLEAQKQSAGCDEGSCLSEIAGAIGAQLVFFGQAGKLGSTIVVTLNVFDAGRGQAIGRQVIEARDLGQLPALVGTAVDQMVRPLFERLRGSVGDAPASMTTVRADPSLHLGARAREVYAQKEMNVCVDEDDRVQWWFCDEKNRYTENQFIRNYHKLTQKTDLGEFEDNRNAESVGVPVGMLIGGTGLIALVGAPVGYLTYLDTGSTSQVLRNPLDDKGTKVGDIIAGGAVLVGAGLAIYGAILLPDALAFSDGQPADHSMKEARAREAAARYNDALAADIGKEYGAGP
jgi:hypothetical protein